MKSLITWPVTRHLSCSSTIYNNSQHASHASFHVLGRKVYHSGSPYFITAIDVTPLPLASTFDLWSISVSLILTECLFSLEGREVTKLEQY
jgi:hypothetical protein